MKDKLAPDAASVSTNLERSSLFLRNDARQTFRLAWEDGKSAGAKQLPAGNYTLVGYRLLRTDDSGVPWFLSATGPSIARFQLKAGTHHEVEMPDTIAMDCQATTQKSQLQLGMSIQGHRQSGLTIYKKERRIAIDYQLLDDTGQSLSTGRMNYG